MCARQSPQGPLRAGWGRRGPRRRQPRWQPVKAGSGRPRLPREGPPPAVPCARACLHQRASAPAAAVRARRAGRTRAGLGSLPQAGTAPSRARRAAACAHEHAASQPRVVGERLATPSACRRRRLQLPESCGRLAALVPGRSLAPEWTAASAMMSAHVGGPARGAAQRLCAAFRLEGSEAGGGSVSPPAKWPPGRQTAACSGPVQAHHRVGPPGIGVETTPGCHWMPRATRLAARTLAALRKLRQAGFKRPPPERPLGASRVVQRRQDATICARAAGVHLVLLTGVAGHAALAMAILVGRAQRPQLRTEAETHRARSWRPEFRCGGRKLAAKGHISSCYTCGRLKPTLPLPMAAPQPTGALAVDAGLSASAARKRRARAKRNCWLTALLVVEFDVDTGHKPLFCLPAGSVS